MLVRRLLHAAGYRYRLHVRGLPGSPDIVFPGRRKAIFVHGCFWHGHDCPMFRLPGTRQEFWAAKIGGNRERDQRKAAELEAAGWCVLTVWECSLKGPARLPRDEITARCATFLKGEEPRNELTGDWQS